MSGVKLARDEKAFERRSKMGLAVNLGCRQSNSGLEHNPRDSNNP